MIWYKEEICFILYVIQPPVTEKLQKQQTKLQKELNTLYENSRAADSAYAAAKEGYYRSQAQLLAAELKDGQPCPVCGAVHHPAPAPCTADTVTREDMEQAEKAQREQHRTEATAKAVLHWAEPEMLRHSNREKKQTIQLLMRRT